MRFLENVLTKTKIYHSSILIRKIVIQINLSDVFLDRKKRRKRHVTILYILYHIRNT